MLRPYDTEPSMTANAPHLPPPQFPLEQSETGAFVRQPDAFRRWVKADGSTE